MHSDEKSMNRVQAVRESAYLFFCSIQYSFFNRSELFEPIYVKQKSKGRPSYNSRVSYVKGSALALITGFLPATSGVLPFRDFAEASLEALRRRCWFLR